jgi:hypothetical protein
MTGSPPGPLGPVETATVGRMAADVSSRAGHGGDSVEEEDEEKKRCLPVEMMHQAAIGSRSTLQVAVFLQMPSPPRSHTVTEEAQNDISVRGELAIGLVELPWTGEHPSSRQGEETTIS